MTRFRKRTVLLSQKPIVQKQSRYLFAAAVVYFAGLIWGAAGVRGNGEFLPLFAENLISLRQTSGFGMVCASVFLSFFVLLFAAFLSGASPFGLPVLSILPFVQGMGTGCVSAYLVLQTGMQGIWTELLIFFVPDALMSLLLIGYISKAADTSVKLFLIHVVQRKNTCARLDDLIRLFLLASSAALGLSLLAGGLNHLFSDLLSSLPAASFPSV